MTAAPTALLAIRGVIHAPTLDGADLTVRAGEFVSVLAPPSAGKSQLLALATGQATPLRGRVRLGGADLATLGHRRLAELLRTTVTRVPQHADTALHPSLTAAENIALRPTLDGVPAAEARRMALSVLLELELADLADLLPRELSPFHRRAVTTARALVSDRPLIVADDPVAGLEPVLADTVLALLRTRAARGQAVLMTTRDPAHAVWADRVLLLQDGALTDPAAPVPAGAAERSTPPANVA